MISSTDKILLELNVTAVQMDLDIWMQGDLQITINGIKPYKDEEIIDVPVFLKSLESDGNYFIFSCNCGLPECSGRTEGIQVFHDNNIIRWIDNLGNNIWYFDKTTLKEDLKNIYEKVLIFKKYFAEKQIDYVGFGYHL